MRHAAQPGANSLGLRCVAFLFSYVVRPQR
nr:MAG TPA: hypothetical protein [Caudoviricetes sp.]